MEMMKSYQCNILPGFNVTDLALVLNFEMLKNFYSQ